MSRTRRKTGSRILGIVMSVVLAFGLTPGLAFAEVAAGEPVFDAAAQDGDYSVRIYTTALENPTATAGEAWDSGWIEYARTSLPEGVEKPSWRLEGAPEGVAVDKQTTMYVTLAGTPAAAGTYDMTLTAYCEVDGAEYVLASQAYTLTVSGSAPQDYSVTITTDSLEAAETGVNYDGYIFFKDGVYPDGVTQPSWEIDGLPEGFSILRQTPSLMQFGGTATEAGAYDLKFTAFCMNGDEKIILATIELPLEVKKGPAAIIDVWGAISVTYGIPQSRKIYFETTPNMPEGAEITMECEDLPKGLAVGTTEPQPGSTTYYQTTIQGTPEEVGSGTCSSTATIYYTLNGETSVACTGQIDWIVRPIDLAQNSYSAVVNGGEPVPYNGAAVEAPVSIKYEAYGDVFYISTGYTLSYSGNDAVTDEAIATITGDGVNVIGEKSAAFEIIPGQIGDCTIDVIPAQSYTGNAIEPALTVKCGENVLKKDVDYTVAFENNTAIGTATATVTGIEGKFEGSKPVNFQIELSEVDAKAVEEVMMAIEGLPDASEIAAGDDAALEKVDSAVAAYLALSDAAKKQISPAAVTALVNAGNAASQAKAGKAGKLEKDLTTAKQAQKAAEDKAGKLEKDLTTAKQAQKAAEDKAKESASRLKANTMDAKAKAVKAKAKAKKKTTVKKAKAFQVTGAVGKVTFYKISGNAKIVVSKSGKVTLKKGLKAKKKPYKVKVLVCAAGDKSTAPAMKMVTLKVKVTK